jgi:hypothetical protein
MNKRGSAGTHGGAGGGAELPETILPQDDGETSRREDLVFPRDPDTVTAMRSLNALHEGIDPDEADGTPTRPRRRDTVPLRAGSPSDPEPVLPRVTFPTLVDADADADADADVPCPSYDADDTTTTARTLPRPQHVEAAREVYRLFLASEYAPALALATELLARGDGDPMLDAIVRECRASLEHPLVAGHDSDTPMFRGIDGRTTLDELAAMTGLSLPEVLALLERFVMIGVLTLRPRPPG